MMLEIRLNYFDSIILHLERNTNYAASDIDIIERKV